MQIDRRLVGFGLFLITVGTVAVAVRQGVLSEEIAGRAWSLWPLILIGIGLSIEANVGDGRLTLAGARLARLRRLRAAQSAPR